MRIPRATCSLLWLGYISLVHLGIGFSDVACAPLGVAYTGRAPRGSRHEIVINEVLRHANKQIKLMKTCIDAVQKHHDATQLEKIKAVFGSKPNLKEIECIVDKLVTGTMDVTNYNLFGDGDSDTYYASVSPTSEGGKALRITSEFYDDSMLDSMPWKRALIIIHEASHYFGHTLDFWVWDSSQKNLFPINENLSPELAKHAMEGSWNKEYDMVFKYANHLMYKNAETWGVFGYYLEHGSFPPHNPPFYYPAESPTYHRAPSPQSYTVPVQRTSSPTRDGKGGKHKLMINTIVERSVYLSSPSSASPNTGSM
ncbi:hypothetical protein CVT24_008089 [Panaeolus cyanescens]|uniref:Lysine-specific metallo-endopeptidase domain-containing protein n=1 Tax=Panaeolus cyanescens TaxID=181874 RepID=A0A409YLG2_9AGAR|nr:hypothetical protein CVT24_008089 [Panaeolus cyanescens]